MSDFDPSSLLSATVDTVQEKRDPLPEGIYTVVLGRPTMKSGEKDGKPWHSCELPVTIEVPAHLQNDLGLPPSLMNRFNIFLDVKPGGGLDTGKGKNNGLRLLREALDMNKPGASFSLSMAEGRVFSAQIKHELYNGSIQERVTGLVRPV